MTRTNPIQEYRCECGNSLYGHMIHPDPHAAPEWEGDEECRVCGRGIDEASRVLPNPLPQAALPLDAADFGPLAGSDEEVPF